MTIKYTDLESAFDFVSFGSTGDNEAYFSQKTGKFYWISDCIDEEEPLPDDLFESSEYLQVPDKHELDLGKRLVFDFVHQYLANDFETVSNYFRNQGAYGRYKALLERKDKLEQWYEFEAEQTKKALLAWAKECDLKVEE
ncbi:hypothetical protein JQC92_19845 [Shewanella sp. 202IG2-18]|uniref:hypothetical protein n=1 Tax=Parashewanella hymeniacidonis TaxID=2807618 RepID=UPI0019604A93|nr:hypothetical protein [Parashewanella hymeniacidonis]MBM7074251.1 hypothetical protein [Parashewanella hymeniacidonis]